MAEVGTGEVGALIDINSERSMTKDNLFLGCKSVKHCRFLQSRLRVPPNVAQWKYDLGLYAWDMYQQSSLLG